MFQEIFHSCWPIFAALLAGWVSGKLMPPRLRLWLVSHIGRFILLLLLVIGIHFGRTMTSPGQTGLLIIQGLVFAVTISAAVIAAVAVLYGQTLNQDEQIHADRTFWHIVWECALALLTVLAGLLLQQGLQSWAGIDAPAPSIAFCLYVLLFLVGTDLSGMHLRLSVLSLRVLMLPGLVVLASLLGGVLTALCMGMSALQGMVLASGFGWFSLSSVLVSAHGGEDLGALMLLVDLFRELLSIFVLYLLGKYRPYAGIAAAGGTAVDTTLPVIRKSCGPHYIPAAVYTGAALSLITPFLLAFLLSFL